MHETLTKDHIADLKRLLNDKVIDQDISDDYSHDEMIIYGTRKPDVVVIPSSKEDVSILLSYANKHHLPVIARGAGTGLCGGCVPMSGGILLDMSRMRKILEIDPKTMTATFEPGVILMEAIEKVADAGFLYAPDPGEKSATIGGNVMTNAGGMRAIKYGVTRDHIKGLEVVLADGSIMTLGGKISKNSSGYDLKDLIIGSEGTLAIVTKIIAKIVPRPKLMTSLLIPFNTLKEALEAVPAIMNLEDTATTIEFMEKEVIEDAKIYLGKDFPNGDYNAYLIVSYSGNNKEEIRRMIETCSELVLEKGAIDVFISDTQERQSSIWDARGAFLEAIKNSSSEMDECDVVVDIDKVADFLDFAKNVAKRIDIRMRSFGHAGDGNLHIYILKDALSDELWKKKAKNFMDELYDEAEILRGQVSGEHGIGHAKREYLMSAISTSEYELMRKIKLAFDPNNILNPGKVIDIKDRDHR